MAIKKFYFEKVRVTTTTVKGWAEIDMDYTQLYHKISELTVMLEDKWALKYLIWVLKFANKDNIIPHGANTMRDFQTYLTEHNVKRIPSEKSIRDAITELIRHGLILKHGYNNYQLNPELLWNSDTEDRIDHLISLNQLGIEVTDKQRLISDRKSLKISN